MPNERHAIVNDDRSDSVLVKHGTEEVVAVVVGCGGDRRFEDRRETVRIAHTGAHTIAVPQSKTGVLN